MSAGLPGLGLGGLFFIFSALLAPLPELWRTLRGRSGVGAWRLVSRQFAQAVAMIVAIDLTIRLVYLGLSATGLGDAPPADKGAVLPLTLIGITSVLLVAVIGMAKLAELGLRIRTAELPRVPEALPLPSPLRTFATGGVVTLAWFALLAGGASELSPLVKPREERTAKQRIDRAQESPSRPVDRPVRQLAAAPSELLRAGAAGSQKPVVDAAGAASPSPGESGDARPALQPSVEARPPAPGPPEGAAVTPAPAAVAPAPSAEPGSSPRGAAPPRATGPPVAPGPPEGSPSSVPDSAGPPPHAGFR